MLVGIHPPNAHIPSAPKPFEYPTKIGSQGIIFLG
jgi:hypothetical protein